MQIVHTLKIIFLIAVFNMSINVFADTITKIFDDDYSMISPFIYGKLGLDMSKILLKSATSPYDDLTRTDNIKYPGYYYDKPLGEQAGVKDEDKEYLKKFLSIYLNKTYYNEDIFNYLDNYIIALYDRKEFFFVVDIDSVRFRFSGWYNEFIHIIVEYDFNNETEFLDGAQQYFVLPKLNIDKVFQYYSEDTLLTGEREYFYAYKHSKNTFNLCGYSILSTRGNTITAEIDKTVLDLTIYTKEQNNDE